MKSNQLKSDEYLVGSERGMHIPLRSKASSSWVMVLLVAGGCLAFGYFVSWWFTAGRLNSAILLAWLIAALLYAGIQMLGNWILYLGADRKNEPIQYPADLSVDVYVTAYREPYSMIERSLAAACAMRGMHRTWLLDDGSDPALGALAERYGAGYLTREDHRDAKAGNLNAALRLTDGDVVVIFDSDHVPQSDFLERSLGYFNDPEVGFVQVMITFGNAAESWVAQAAMETSLEFYNPTYLGMDVLGGATMMGSNALIRRKALEAIGGYRPGLAEDLATSIALHAAGWRSAYVPEPLAPGQAPPSFTAWFVQQLKWARGVFELLLTAFPRLFIKLTWGQRLSYAVRMTKYWIGPVIGLHLFFTIAVLVFATSGFRIAFHDYLLHLAPLVGFDVLIRAVAFRKWLHPSTPKTTLTRAVYLVYATWPIYMVAWIMAVLRLPLSFRPTPKSSGRLNPIWLMPQSVVLILLVAGMLYTTLAIGHDPSVLLIFAILQGLFQLAILTQWLMSEIRMSEDIPRYLQAIKTQFQSIGIVRREVDGRIRTYITDLPLTIDPLPLEGIEKTINTLSLAGKQRKHIFVLSDSESHLLAGMFASELVKATPNANSGVYRVYSSSTWERAGATDKDNQKYKRVSYSELPRLVEQGDILLGISMAGDKREIVEAIVRAREAKARTISIAGQANPEKMLADIRVTVPGDTMEQVSDSILIVQHVVCKALREMQSGVRLPDGLRKEDTRSRELPQITPISAWAVEAAHRFSQVNTPVEAMELLESLSNLYADVRLALLPDFRLRRALENAMKIFKVSGGSMIVFDADGKASQAAIGFDGVVSLYPTEHLVDTLQRGLAGWVVKNRHPALVVDTRRDRRWLRRSWDETQNSRSAISTPIVYADRAVGILTLVHQQPEHFSETDLSLLVAIAAGLTYHLWSQPEQQVIEYALASQG